MQKNFLTNAVQSGLHPETRLAKLLLITLAHKVPSYPAGFLSLTHLPRDMGALYIYCLFLQWHLYLPICV